MLPQNQNEERDLTPLLWNRRQVQSNQLNQVASYQGQIYYGKNNEGIFKHLERILTNPNASDLEMVGISPPEVHFYKAPATPILEGQNIFDIPVVFSKSFKLNGNADNKNHVYAELDFNTPHFDKNVLEAYACTCAVTLEEIMKSKENFNGATFLLRGWVPKSFLDWIKSPSVVKVSPIPNVDVILAVPVLKKEEPGLSNEEYFFFLRKTTNRNLLMGNQELKEDRAKDFYTNWDITNKFLPLTLVLDVAIFESSNYMTFVLKFWEKTKNEKKKQVPWFNCDLEPIIQKYQGKPKQFEKLNNDISSLRQKLKPNDFSSTDLYHLSSRHLIDDICNNKDYNNKHKLRIEDIDEALLEKENDLYDMKWISHFKCIKQGEYRQTEWQYHTEVDYTINLDLLFYAKLFQVLQIIGQIEPSDKEIEDFWENIRQKTSHSQLFLQFLGHCDKLKTKPFGLEGSDQEEALDIYLDKKVKSDSLISEEIQYIYNQNLSQQAPSGLKGYFYNQDRIDEFCNKGKIILKKKITGDKPAHNAFDAQLFRIVQQTPLTEDGLNLDQIENNKFELIKIPPNTIQQIQYIRTSYRKRNLLKFIYVIKDNDTIIVAKEKIYNDDKGIRPTHSELAEGLGVKVAGEILFCKHEGRWLIKIINNGSGHYRPFADTIKLAEERIVQKMSNKGIQLDRIELRNSVTPDLGFEDEFGLIENNTELKSFLSECEEEAIVEDLFKYAGGNIKGAKKS